MTNSQDPSDAMIEAGELAFTEAALENASKGEICSAVYLAMQSARISTPSEDVGLLASLRAFVAEHARGVPMDDDRQGTAIILIDEAANALAALKDNQPTKSECIADEARFLCARLREWESVCDSDECCREYGGHVVPSLARLETLLASGPTKDRETDREALLHLYLGGKTRCGLGLTDIQKTVFVPEATCAACLEQYRAVSRRG